MKLLILLPIILTLVFFVPQISYEHQSGCHRWHSCPSDSGSYVCGDLGYDNYCPNIIIEEYEPQYTHKPLMSEPQIQYMTNLRGEPVIVFYSSVEKLLERGYLVLRE